MLFLVLNVSSDHYILEIILKNFNGVHISLLFTWKAKLLLLSNFVIFNFYIQFLYTCTINNDIKMLFFIVKIYLGKSITAECVTQKEYAKLLYFFWLSKRFL